MNTVRYLSLFLIVCFKAHAQIVVVSDVDDTIKVSHVLDPDSAVGNSLKVGNVFRGMLELYREIKNQNTLTQFYYLTNAPEALFNRIHGLFLKIHGFPEGSLLLRNSLSDHNHKLNSLREIMKQQKPNTLILIGDNGERDPEVYHQISLEFPDIKILTFIREAYSSQHEESDDRGTRLRGSQIGFTTPTEISLVLLKSDFLAPSQVDELEYNYVIPTTRLAHQEDKNGETGTLCFPNWIDCRDHQIGPLLLERQSPWAQRLVNRIQYRCSVPPFND